MYALEEKAVGKGKKRRRCRETGKRNDDEEADSEDKDNSKSKQSRHLSDDKMVNVTPEKDKSKTSS